MNIPSHTSRNTPQSSAYLRKLFAQAEQHEFDAPVALPSDLPLEDWVDLLAAIEARLTECVGEQPPGSHALELPPGRGRVKASVLECAAALGQLHTALGAELTRRRRLELQVFDGQTVVAQLRAELAGRRDGERRALHQARHDGLTALPNRSFFHERLGDTLARVPPYRQPVAVLYLDLDGFKTVNDTHGHAVGDQLLGIVAQRLHRAIRADDMVSRMGGDEFACLVMGLSTREQLCRLAGNLFDAVSAPVHIGELQLQVCPSIGIALCPGDADTPEALLRKADEAMYQAKRRQSGYAFAG